MQAQAAGHGLGRQVAAGQPHGHPLGVEVEALERLVGPGPVGRRVAVGELGGQVARRAPPARGGASRRRAAGWRWPGMLRFSRTSRPAEVEAAVADAVGIGDQREAGGVERVGEAVGRAAEQGGVALRRARPRRRRRRRRPRGPAPGAGRRRKAQPAVAVGLPDHRVSPRRPAPGPAKTRSPPQRSRGGTRRRRRGLKASSPRRMEPDDPFRAPPGHG